MPEASPHDQRRPRDADEPRVPGRSSRLDGPLDPRARTTGFGNWKPGDKKPPSIGRDAVSRRWGTSRTGASKPTRSRSRTPSGRTSSSARRMASASTPRPPTRVPDMYVSGSPRQAWSYQAGHTAGSPVTTESAAGRADVHVVRVRGPDRDRRPDHRDALPVFDRGRHRAVRATDRRGSRRQPLLPASAGC